MYEYFESVVFSLYLMLICFLVIFFVDMAPIGNNRIGAFGKWSVDCESQYIGRFFEF